MAVTTTTRRIIRRRRRRKEKGHAPSWIQHAQETID